MLVENKRTEIPSLMYDMEDPLDYFTRVTEGLEMKDTHQLLSVLNGGSVFVPTPESADGVEVVFTPQKSAHPFEKRLLIEGGGHSSLLSMKGFHELEVEVGETGSDDKIKGEFFTIGGLAGKDVLAGSFDLALVPSEHWSALRIAKKMYDNELNQRRIDAEAAKRVGGGALGRFRPKK